MKNESLNLRPRIPTLPPAVAVRSDIIEHLLDPDHLLALLRLLLIEPVIANGRSER
jgi:hypothetical protein